ncbi:hypothetical protein [Sphingomonas koreensis]|uniref:hypothetical protein n=1 Tax=Sphingomonas koreensis TaxID=93064 RepID=UPI000F7E5540|nr:hypothetical protein [Sphingomonas koreensis]
MFFLEHYRDGFGILIENAESKYDLKHHASREDSEGKVVWHISWHPSWGSEDLPETGRKICDLVREFLVFYEPDKQVEVLFGR